MTKKIVLSFLFIAVLFYLVDRYSFYLDRQFHYLNQSVGPSIKVDLLVERIYIQHKEFSFDPPIKISKIITEDSTTQIREIKQIDGESFGVSFAYHHSLTNISKIGNNPEFQKRMTVEILFYKRNIEQPWKWYITSTHLIDKIIGTDKPGMSGLTFQDLDNNKKEYGIYYEFTVK